MPRREHAHVRTQPSLRAALLTLAICAVVTTFSAPSDGGAAGVVLAAAAASPSSESQMAAPVPTSLVSVPEAGTDDLRAPIDETLRAAPVPTRPAISVPAPELRVAFGAAPGSTAVYLGDSFTSGWNGAGLGARGWPRLVGMAQDWQTVNLAVAGTGFINPGWTGQPIGSRVAEAIRHHPDVIVLAGGHNDSRWPASATADAADAAIDRLRAGAPDALLVIVAPIWQNGSPPRRCLDLRDRLRRKAASVGAVFIDPLAGGWFSGPSHRLIGPDGLHPTDAGHRYIADRVQAALAGG
jgi:lysophospholipase L1-like esterase